MSVYYNGVLICPDLYYNGVVVKAGSLLPIALFDGSITGIKSSVTEGATVNLNLLPVIDGRFTGLRRWSQLLLDSVLATIQYENITSNITDFGDSDLRFGQDVWHGEHASDSDVDVSSVSSSERPLYYRTSDNRFRLYSTNIPRTWVTPFPNHYDILEIPHRWLGSLSDSELTDYFQNNSYNSNRRYYFFQESSGEVRRYTQTKAWLNFDSEQDDVRPTELTLETDLLLNDGRLSVSLSADAIDADKDGVFRIKIDLLSGTETFIVYLPLDLLNSTGSVLTGLTTPQSAVSRVYREGDAEQILELVNLISGLDAWDSDITVTAKMQYQATADDEASWTDMGALGFQGLLTSEYTIRILSNGRVGFAIHNNSIDTDIDDRLRLVINLEDSNMANLILRVPFDARSLTSLSSLANETNVTARTYREGAALDTFGLAQFISGLTNWNEVHLDSVSAVVRVSTNSGGAWATHSSEQDGLDTDEYTLNTDDLLANGNLGFRLHADSILSDIAHDDTTRFEIYVTMTSSGVNKYVLIPLNLRAPTSLSALTTPQQATSRIYREGASEVRFNIEDLIIGIDDINDLNLDTATVTVQYQATEDDDTTWTDMGVLGFQGLLPSEYTVDNDIRVTGSDRGEVGFRIHPDTIGADINGRLRFEINLGDGS